MTDPRTALWLQMLDGERRILEEIETEQVVHVDLALYQPGAERYERLIESMNLAQRFQQPNSLEFNL